MARRLLLMRYIVLVFDASESDKQMSDYLRYASRRKEEVKVIIV